MLISSNWDVICLHCTCVVYEHSLLSTQHPLLHWGTSQSAPSVQLQPSSVWQENLGILLKQIPSSWSKPHPNLQKLVCSQEDADFKAPGAQLLTPVYTQLSPATVSEQHTCCSCASTGGACRTAKANARETMRTI